MTASSQTDHRPPGPVRAAAGVIAAAIEQGHSTAYEIASAQNDAGILFDPTRAQAIADASRKQGLTEAGAELTQLRQDREAMWWFHRRMLAVAQLCVGRRDDHLLSVREVLTAVDGHQATGAPLTITWDGLVAGPSGDTEGENTLVPCTTSRGGSAVLVLDDEQRLKLGELLLATLHPAETCVTPGCGMTQEEVDACDPPVSDWILVRVAGASGPARWWCSVWCANSAITAGGAELAAADRTAAVDPDAQAPFTALPVDTVVLHRFEPEQLGESDAKRRVARCRHCAGARTDAIHIWADNDQAAAGGDL